MHSDALHSCLRRLAPHLDLERIALTGGVAIGIRAAQHRADTTRAAAADDIDLVAGSADAVRSSVSTDFLISHFHLPQPGYAKFLVQLGDAAARLRVDVFPDALTPARYASALSAGAR